MSEFHRVNVVLLRERFLAWRAKQKDGAVKYT